MSLKIVRFVARLLIVGCMHGGERRHSYLIKNRLDDLLSVQQLRQGSVD